MGYSKGQLDKKNLYKEMKKSNNSQQKIKTRNQKRKELKMFCLICEKPNLNKDINQLCYICFMKGKDYLGNCF